MDDHCNPKLADFGMSVLHGAGSNTMGTSFGSGGTLRWMAPELLRENGRVSFSADVYAFACVCIEVCLDGVILLDTGPMI